MSREYTRDEMLELLKKHFEKNKYEVEEYCDSFLPARVPLYCKKENGSGIDEVVIEITTDEIVSKEAFFHSPSIGGVTILDASPMSFYQYYFPTAKIFFAYPDYVKENNEFSRFIKFCEKKGIGLLKVSQKEIKGIKDQVKEVVNARPLYSEICNELNLKNHSVKDRLEYHLRNCLHYFVYYPKSVFKRRAIMGRTEGNISLLLIDKLCELKNIAHKKILIKLASEYRRETRDDYQIALETIKDLWRNVSEIEYPEIQRQLEDILLHDTEYRDHFLHQFQVFLLGAYIIDKLYDKEKEYIEHLNRSYKCRVEKAWLLASTYHDFNYSIQKYDFWSKEFLDQSLNTTGKDRLSSLNLDAAFIKESFLLKTTEVCKALGLEMNHIVTNFFYEQATTKKNHGLLSALSLLKLFENSAKKKINHSALIQAALAITLHDEHIWKVFSGRDDGEKWSSNFAKKKYLENLNFQKLPLGFLLVFCDTVQEWGRVGKNYEESKPRLDDIKLGNNEIEVTISVENNDSYKEKMEELERVAKFLKGEQFVIILKSRVSGKSTRIPMKGLSS